ncbi:MAG: hypothetical protein AAFQ89_12080 [Cyanobacteria bacterium J06626_18]
MIIPQQFRCDPGLAIAADQAACTSIADSVLERQTEIHVYS